MPASSTVSGSALSTARSASLPGFERALLVLVERQIGAVGGRAAQRVGAAERLAPAPRAPWSDRLVRMIACEIGRNGDTGTLSVASATFTPASSSERSGLISRWRSGGSRCASSRKPLVEIVVGVGGEHQPHAGDLLDLARRGHADVADHPAPPLERNLAIDLLVEVEIARADHDRADVVRRAMEQQLLGLRARQAVGGIEAGPSGIGRGARAQIVRRLAADMDVEPAHLEPVVAEAGLAQPAGPGLDERPERRVADRLPVRAEGERSAHGQRALAMGLLVDAHQLARDPVPLEHAGGAEGVIGARR